ncbi:MAG: RsmE family RNA methyltransferase [Planctomycetota bacterium]|nr:RsmE family RNA methyltransferase [Planctomycetota bacterium]
MHCVYCETGIEERGAEQVIDGPEAQHAARVKRLGPGDRLWLMDGRGVRAVGEVVEARRALRVRIVERGVQAEVRPRVEVWSATPKGPRVAELVEGLVQVGAASWTPMATKLGVVDPGEGKLARLERIVIESCKQAGRARLLELSEKRTLSEALAPGPGVRVVMADAGGGSYARAGDGSTVRLLIGPEGGFTEEERRLAQGAGATLARFGPMVMRIETAGVVAAGVVLNVEQ